MAARIPVKDAEFYYFQKTKIVNKTRHLKPGKGADIW